MQRTNIIELTEKKKCRAKTRVGDPCHQWALIDGLCSVHFHIENKIKDDRKPGEKYGARKSRGDV